MRRGFESKFKFGSTVSPIRVYLDGALIHFDQGITDHQSHAQAFWILACSSVQLAKHFEDFTHFYSSYSFSRVYDARMQGFARSVVGRQNLDRASFSKLECIVSQVSQNLSQTKQITLQPKRQAWLHKIQIKLWVASSVISTLKLLELDGLPSKFGPELLSLKLENIDDFVKEFFRLKQLSTSR